MQEADVAVQHPRQGTLLHLWCLRMVLRQMMKSMCVAWNMCSQEAGWMLGLTLEFSHPQQLVPACHTPCHHAFPFINCLHGLHGRSNLHMGSKIPHGIENSDPGILAVTARSWSKNGSLTSSLRPLCGAYTDRQVTTRWPPISFTQMILSESLCTIKISISTLRSQTLLHQQCLCRFRSSRACTWCSCPWLCGSCHHGIWSPENSRHSLSCGIVFSLPHKLFLSEFPQMLAWFATMARPCLSHLTEGQAGDVTNRTLMSFGTA